MAKRLENSVGRPTRVQALPMHLLLVDDRNEEIRRDEHQCPAKLRRRHANDRERMLVQLDDPAYYIAVILKAAVPVGKAEHQIRRAIRTALIRRAKKAAKIGMNLEHIEVVASCGKAVRDRWIATRIQAHKSEIERGQILKAVVAIPQIDIVGIRLKSRILPVRRSIQVFGLRHIQWPQHQSFHDSENYGVSTDRQCQGENRQAGEARGFAQHAYCKSPILQ